MCFNVTIDEYCMFLNNIKLKILNIEVTEVYLQLFHFNTIKYTKYVLNCSSAILLHN